MQSNQQRLDDILTHHQITPYYQPIWRLQDSKLLGFELLSRFDNGLSPTTVWQWALEYDRWLELDRLAIRYGLEMAQTLSGLLFVNISAQRLTSHLRAEGMVHRIIARYRSPHDLVLEVTEGAVDNVLEAIQEVRNFRQLGVRFALDDANSGASNPERMRWLRPDYVKIDRPVVLEFLSGRSQRLRSWVQMAHAQEITVIAEGVEDRESTTRLLDAGVDHVQGFGFGRPAPADQWTPSTLALLAPHLSSPLFSTGPAPIPSSRRSPPLGAVSPFPLELVGSLLFNQYPAPMVLLDHEGRVLSLNPAAEHEWQAALEDVAGVVWLQAFHVRWDTDQPESWSILHTVLTEGQRLGCVVVGRDGRIHTSHIIGVDVQLLGETYTFIVVLEPPRMPPLPLPFWAFRDPLTGLGNRALWEKDWHQWDRQSGVVGIADLNRLKTINDTAGHTAGDQVLALIGTTFKDAIPSNATAFRYGGDEFVVVLPNATLEFARQWEATVKCQLRKKSVLKEMPLELSWGWEPFTPGTLLDSLNQADEAMYARRGVLLKATHGGRLVLLRSAEPLLAPADHEPLQHRPGQFADQIGQQFNTAFRRQFRSGRDLARQFIELVEPQPGTAVVEIGAGAGRLAFEGGLAQRVGAQGQLLLTDPSRAQLDQARELAAQQGFGWIRFLQTPAESIPLASGGADLVLGAMFLHLCDRRRALHEMLRITRPGGRIALAVVLEFPWPPVWRAIWEPAQRALAYHALPMRHVFDFHPGDIGRLCEWVGLAVEHTEIIDAGDMEFPDVELARKFIEQGGHLPVMTQALPAEEQARVQSLVDRRLRQVFARTPPQARAVRHWQLEHIVARKRP